MMTAPLDRLSEKLSEIRAYVEAATDEPWFAEQGDVSARDGEHYVELHDDFFHDEADAEFTARARTDLPLLLAVATAAERFVSLSGKVESGEYMAADTALCMCWNELQAALAALSEQA